MPSRPLEAMSAGLCVPGTCFHYRGGTSFVILLALFPTKGLNLNGSPFNHCNVMLLSVYAVMQLGLKFNWVLTYFANLAQISELKSSSLGSDIGFNAATLLRAKHRLTV